MSDIGYYIIIMERKIKFASGEYYHIYSRTILNIPEFKNHKHAEKLAHAFLIANSTKSSEAFQFLRNSKKPKIEEILNILKDGERLVDILCYSVMPDHYHLLLKQQRENGITDFIRRCNTSIAKYINTKNERKGPLFESNFKSKHVDTNEYLLHLSLYIHLNPLDFMVGKKWRNHDIKNWNIAKEKLLHYPWSSIKSFLQNYDDPIISGIKIITKQFKHKKDYEQFLQEWSENSLKSIENILID